MHLFSVRPPEKRTSVSLMRTTHWQHRLLLQHENLTLHPFFELPRVIVLDILMNWIAIDSLCVFDTAISQKDSWM